MAEAPALVTRSEFWTDDLDSAVDHLRARYVDHSRVPKGRAPFGWGYRALATADVSAGIVTSAGANVLRAALSGAQVIVHLPLTHSTDYRVGRRTLATAPGRALLLPPHHDYTLHDAGGSTLAVVVRAVALEEELERTWSGRRGYLALRAAELPLSADSRVHLRGLLRRLRVLSTIAPNVQDAQAVQSLNHDFVAWLGEQVAMANGLQSISPPRRRRVERIERWIDAHPGEKIELDRLARVAGVGPRALTKATMAARGLAPMELVASRRLELSRRMLSRGEATTVASIANDCGFTHLGRFAAAYRSAFGESPSSTLARHRRPTDE